MTNEEKYKTAKERFDAFEAMCKSRDCSSCQLKSSSWCEFAWLELEAEAEDEVKPCPFCGEASRLGVQTKWLGREGRVGGYARCKSCHARGPLVTLDGIVLDIRNERLSKDGKQAIIDKAVEAWNGKKMSSDDLPLFKEVFK